MRFECFEIAGKNVLQELLKWWKALRLQYCLQQEAS
jgi:hypothetical protein